MAAEGFFEEEAMMSCVDESDLAEVKKHAKSMAKDKTFQSDLKEAVTEHVKKHSGEVAKAGVASKRRSKKGKEEQPAKHDKHEGPPTSEDRGHIAQFLPDSPWKWSLAKDISNQRWLVTNVVLGNMSSLPGTSTLSMGESPAPILGWMVSPMPKRERHFEWQGCGLESDMCGLPSGMVWPAIWHVLLRGTSAVGHWWV
eukprot:1609251-Lingulodinium_polyedra.AAC.2